LDKKLIENYQEIKKNNNTTEKNERKWNGKNGRKTKGNRYNVLDALIINRKKRN